jgi:hypothetical protein
MGILCFIRKQSIEKSPINPEDLVNKYNNINESIYYLNNYSRFSKGGFYWLMMTLSF